MPVVVIGVNHRTAPLAVLEAMSVGEDALGKTLHSLLATENVSEAVVLSTCNRTEVYAVAERFHGGYADVRQVLGELAFLDPVDFSDHLYVHHDGAAVAHLFEVVSGLDSAVLGEHEIQGQVKGAWEAAQRHDAVGTTLNLLFRRALEVGKRVRTETAIGTGTASVSYAAVALAERELGTLGGRRAVVLGTGEMGASMAASLADAGVADLVLANRTFQRARDVAAERGGRAVHLSELSDALAEADVVLTSTGASAPVLTVEDIAPIVAGRADRPLVLVDIAVPRDVDPAVAQLDGVVLLDMDDLRAFAAAAVAGRQREVQAVRNVIDEELERFRAASSAREMTPVIVALRDAAEQMRQAELQRIVARAGVDADLEATLEAATQALVAKLLHGPMVALRDNAGTAKGDRLVQALRDLFDIDL